MGPILTAPEPTRGSPTEAQIRSMDYPGMDYAISSCYRKIFDVESDENARLCMDMFNCDNVDTMLTKRRQKFFDGHEHWTIYCAK